MSQSITDFELQVMAQLWTRGGRARVAEVLESWPAGNGAKPGYTTILKTLQNLEEKGVVTHESGAGRAYVYVAQVDRREGSRSRLRQLVNTVFGGDHVAFAHAFLADADLSEREVDELQRLFREYDQSAAAGATAGPDVAASTDAAESGEVGEPGEAADGGSDLE